MNTQELIIMQGIPGSGKSYMARQLLKADTEYKTVIVNRDDIRDMLGDYWIPSREGLVTTIEDNMIKSSLTKGYTVIVDATNLNPKTIKKLEKIALSKKVKVKYVPVMVTPTQAFIQILWRTIRGGRFISYKVVKGFYDRYQQVVEEN